MKVDYTKFKLKAKEEILEILKGHERIYILSCNKCFNELTTDFEPETASLNKLLNESARTTVGFMPLDFLCNKYLTGKALESVKQDIAGADAIAVISCGVGVQTIAELLSSPVFAVCDSVYQGGYHGISLNTERCGACGECYLSSTGGICPVVDCSKSLLNGPCGGAKKGKCEVSKDKNCGWENIFNRLAGQKREGVLLAQKPNLRNYNKNNATFIDTYVKSIQGKRNEGFYGGLYPEERKELTGSLAISKITAPELVYIPMQQHAGAACDPVVKVGDKVKLGQLLGESKAAVSASVHASVSGEVIKIETRKHPLLPFPVVTVVIRNNKKDEHVAFKKIDPSSATKQYIIGAIKEAGIVGMGGAQFPTHVKLNSNKPVDIVLLNGCECEPLLNADNRLMLEQPKKVLDGLKLLMKAAGVVRGVVAVEDNKPEAFEVLSKETAAMTGSGIEIVKVKTKYPEGAERMLIKRVLNRVVPLGGLPLDVGVIVNNISTACAVFEAVVSGMPLVCRVVTVAGEGVAKPGNYEVPIGILLSDIVKVCGINVPASFELKMGGAIMGFPQLDLDVPVIKGTNGVVVVRKKDDLNAEPCIKCGRCVNVCPMELKPHKLVFYAQAENWDKVEKEGVMNCIECGCCEDICSSKSHMVEIFRKSKKLLRERKK